MSRLNQRQQTEKEMFLEDWEEPYYNGLSSWREYLEISLEFFKKEFKSYNEKIKEIDKIHAGKFYEIDDDFAGVYTVDGHEVYEDDMISLSVAKEKVFPLILIGIYTEFESTLIGICKKLERIKPELGAFNGVNITNCKDNYLCKSEILNLVFSESLNTSWKEINEFRELRNLLAHGDNPIDVTRIKKAKSGAIKKAGEERLALVRCIQDVSVAENYYVTFDNEKPLLNFIGICDGFISNLITEIANKIYE
jgi:hypothetical protein